jgi:hypothetical protein
LNIHTRLRDVIFLIVMALLFSAVAHARIQRSAAEVLAFKRANPCPSTQLRRDACPGYQVDHVMPLCAGGADKTENLQWLTVADHRVKTQKDLRVCRYLRKARQQANSDLQL